MKRVGAYFWRKKEVTSGLDIVTNPAFANLPGNVHYSVIHIKRGHNYKYPGSFDEEEIETSKKEEQEKMTTIDTSSSMTMYDTYSSSSDSGGGGSCD